MEQYDIDSLREVRSRIPMSNSLTLLYIIVFNTNLRKELNTFKLIRQFLILANHKTHVNRINMIITTFK